MRVGSISRRCAGKPLAGGAPLSGHHHRNKGGFFEKQDFAPSPSFQVVSRASRSPPQGGSAASTMNATCGPKCCGLSGNCSPVGCLEKMLLASSVWGSTKRSLTWSRQVTMFGFSYYLLLPLARGTNGNGYSSSAPLLPTPLASDTGDVGKGLGHPNLCEWQLPQDEQGRQGVDGAAFPCGLPHAPPPRSEKPYLNPDWVEWLMVSRANGRTFPLGRRTRRHLAPDRRCAEPQQADENAGQCGFAAAGVPDSQIHCGH